MSWREQALEKLEQERCTASYDKYAQIMKDRVFEALTELSTENNCGKLRIVQIHGFQNDKKAKEPPEVRHADFLKLWLEWVHDGSSRDKDGRPEIQTETPKVDIA